MRLDTMDKLDFDFQPFGEQLVRLYQEKHLEDQIDPQVAGQAAEIFDNTVSQWNQAEAPALESVSEQAEYEVKRRADLGDRLRAELGDVASEGFADYAARQTDLVVQEHTIRLGFQDYLKAFAFEPDGEPKDTILEPAKEHGESEGFRQTIATAYHHFCSDFQLEEAFRDHTQNVVAAFQSAFMRDDFRHLLARFRDVGHQALDEAGYKR
jgi:hypothetical protein